MTYSNFSSTLPALVAATVTVLGLAACDGRRASSLEEATFLIESVDVSTKEKRTIDVETKTEQRLFQFSACLLDEAARSPIVRTRFQVSDGVTNKDIVSDNSGCLLWEERHRVSELSHDRLLRIQRTVKAVEGFSGTVTADLAFNMWAGELLDIRKLKELPEGLETTQNLLTFQSDLQALALPGTTSTIAEAYLKDVALEFIEHDKSASEITPLMTLKTAQKFRLRLSPSFIRRNYENEIVNVDLKGGSFNVWIVLTKRDPNKGDITSDDIVAEYQGPIKVLHDGTATKDIHLRVHDTAGVLSRNHVLVAIEPQGKATLRAKSGFFTGFISPLRGNDAGIALIPAEGDAQQIARVFDSALDEVRSSAQPRQVLARYSGLLPDQKNPEALTRAISDSRSNRDKKALLKSYCADLYAPDLIIKVPREGWFSSLVNAFDKDDLKEIGVLKACLKNPELFVSLDARDVVEAIVGQPKYVSGSTVPKTITIGRDVSFSHVQSLSSTASASASAGISGDAGIGWSAPIPPNTTVLGGAPSAGAGFKIAAGADWSVAVAKSKSSSTGVSTSVSEGHQFAVISDAYEIEADVHHCAVVSALVDGGKKGFYACQPNTSRRTFVETYYLINHGIGSSPFSDESAWDNTRWRLTIRGDQMYRQFEELMTKGNTVLEFSRLTLKVNTTSKLLPDFRVTQEFPGTVLP